MPNSFGTLVSSPVLTVALALAVAQRPILRAITTDLSQLDPAAVRESTLNGTISARISTVPTVTDYTEGKGAENAGDTDVPVVLNQFKQVSRNFTAAEIQACYRADASSSRNIILEAARPLATAVGNYLVDSVVALWTHANFPQAGAGAPTTTGGVGGRYVKAAGSIDFNALVDMSVIAAQLKMPQDDRFVCLNALGYGTLLKDATVTNRFALDKADTESGKFGHGVAGFDSIQQHADFAAANATANMVGFFGSKDSTILATRLPANVLDIPGVSARSASAYGIITEPTTGISVMAIETVTELSLTVKLVWLQGTAKGNPNNGMLIISA